MKAEETEQFKIILEELKKPHLTKSQRAMIVQPIREYLECKLSAKKSIKKVCQIANCGSTHIQTGKTVYKSKNNELIKKVLENEINVRDAAEIIRNATRQMVRTKDILSDLPKSKAETEYIRIAKLFVEETEKAINDQYGFINTNKHSEAYKLTLAVMEKAQALIKKIERE